VRRVDPTGLVDWEGTQTTIAAGEGGGAVRFKFKLESDCVNGKQATAEVIAGGMTLTAGIPASFTHSRSVKFEDNLSTPDPSVFSGSAKYVYASWAMGHAGVSYQWIKLGGATALGGGHQMGWDTSVAGGAGISTVVNSSIKDCECE
jgi:hypothetical protein